MENKNKSEGKFIVLEGIDGSGKSTQVALLRKKLEEQGKEVYTTTEPTDRPVGRLIRQILRKEIHATEEVLAALFVADRLDHIQNEENGMLDLLKHGTYVISDRYYWSSFAYHSLKLPMEQVVEMNQPCHNMLFPDITLFLDISAEESMKRILARNESLERFEQLELLKKIRQNYLSAFESYHKSLSVEIVDAKQSISNLHKSIWQHIETIL